MTLNDFLTEHSGPQPSNHCLICKDERLAAEVKQYAEGRRDGTISHSVNFIWDRYFGPNYGMKTASGLRNHIRHHLGITL